VGDDFAYRPERIDFAVLVNFIQVRDHLRARGFKALDESII
jgi:hypothetical protein